MSSMFSSLFGRDPSASFNFDIPAESFYRSGGISAGWTKRKTTGERATCFSASSGDDGHAALKRSAHQLKTLRHPGVITFQDCLETDKCVYLVTETCQPLELYLQEADLTGDQKEMTVSWGLWQILNTLKFLHEGVKLSHESLHTSIYVSSSGDWKLGGFDCCTEFRSSKCDMNSLAQLLWEIFNGFDSAYDRAHPKAPGKMPKTLHKVYSKLCHGNAGKLTAQGVLTEVRSPGGFLRNKFVDTLLFLEEFQLKEARDKVQFFNSLRESLDLFPEDIAKCKILPQLIQAYEFGDAGSAVLAPLFRLAKLLSEEEYQQKIVPAIVKLFGSTDRVTRVKLLEKLDEFGDHLSPAIVNDKIYNNVQQGFVDTNPAVREVTVKAMVTLAPKLNYQNLNVGLMQHLARLQGKDDQAGIRTNATICLGKIGSYLHPQHRQKILISAFTRSLKDPFPPARTSGILALSATQHYYPLVEVANRILPAICPLLVDPEKQVRDQALKAVRGFVEKLERASEHPELITEMESQVQAGGGGGIMSAEKGAAWASWALGALGSKFYKSSTPPVTNSSVVITDANSSGNTGLPASSTAAKTTATATKPDSLKTKVTKPKPSKNNADLWGDIDFDDEEAEEEGGWGDFEDALPSPNATDDAVPSSASRDLCDEDDELADFGEDRSMWGVRETSTSSTTKPAVPSKSHASPVPPKKLSAGAGKGGLKLGGARFAATLPADTDEDLDRLLGVTNVSKPASSSAKKSATASSSSVTRPVVCPSGAGKKTTGDAPASGWDFDDSAADFGNTSPDKTTDWNDDTAGWGDDFGAEDDKEKRKREAQQRLEQRRKEMQQRKLNKTAAGGSKFGAKKL